MKTESIIAEKAYVFAIEIVKLYKILAFSKKEYVLSKQLLRSGTSIGANVNEAVSAVSKKDFVHKLGISLKEARESAYWFRFLKDSDYIKPADFNILNHSCDELIKILSSIIITTKQKYFTNKTQTTYNS